VVGNCYEGAISGLTISTSSTVITPATGQSLLTCASSAGLFIESELQGVGGAVVPPGILDVLDFVFAGNLGSSPVLPIDLSMFGPGRIDLQWLHPDTAISAGVNLHGVPVPEPASLGLLAVGIAGLLFLRRRPVGPVSNRVR